jgi:hypothetical protein
LDLLFHELFRVKPSRIEKPSRVNGALIFLYSLPERIEEAPAKTVSDIEEAPAKTVSDIDFAYTQANGFSSLGRGNARSTVQHKRDGDEFLSFHRVRHELLKLLMGGIQVSTDFSQLSFHAYSFRMSNIAYPLRQFYVLFQRQHAAVNHDRGESDLNGPFYRCLRGALRPVIKGYGYRYGSLLCRFVSVLFSSFICQIFWYTASRRPLM